MVIKKLTIGGAVAKRYGLESFKMSRLGRFVAIAGKNGAGKSRLLNALRDYCVARNEAYPRHSDAERAIKSLETSIVADISNEAKRSYAKEIVKYKEALSASRDYIDSDAIFINVMPFVPKHNLLESPDHYTQRNLIDKYMLALSSSPEGYSHICLGYIQHLQNVFRESTHAKLMISQEEAAENVSDYDRLEDLIYQSLGERLGRNANGMATLFGNPIAEANLSAGQQIALQIVVAIHAHKKTFSDKSFVILLDEPENHLHPSILIDLIEKLDNISSSSQFWIATHSVPLLAYIAGKDPMSIWFAENGSVSNAGRHPERVLQSLIGDEERIGQLRRFADLPSVLAMSNFAAESLLPPQTLSAEEGDDQIAQISERLHGIVSGRPLNVLDFGAGKGRVLEGLVSMMGPDKVSDNFNYYAYDSYSKDSEVCNSLICEYYGNGKSRYFSTVKEYYESEPDGTIDVVVLCNVLHEIHPREWLELFSTDSLIMRSLSEHGYLLIVEDQSIPVGERAHEHGFFVLNTDQIKKLFDVGNEDLGSFLISQKRDGRLKAHLIGKNVVKKINKDTRRNAMRALRTEAISELKRIRMKEDYSYKAGLQHAFWTQQLANTVLYDLE